MERLRGRFDVPDQFRPDPLFWAHFKQKARRQLADMLLDRVRLSRGPIVVWPMDAWHLHDWRSTQIQCEVRIDTVIFENLSLGQPPRMVRFEAGPQFWTLPETTVYQMSLWKRLKFLVTKRL